MKKLNLRILAAGLLLISISQVSKSQIIKTVSFDDYPTSIKPTKIAAGEIDSLLGRLLLLNFTELSGVDLSCAEFKEGILGIAENLGYDAVMIKDLSPKEAVLLSGEITSSLVEYQKGRDIKEVGSLCIFLESGKTTDKSGNCQVFAALNKFVFDVLKDGNPNLENTYMGYFSPSITLNTIRALTKNPDIPQCEGGGEHHIWNRVLTISSDTIFDSFVDAGYFPDSYDALDKEHFGFLDKVVASGEFYQKEEILETCEYAEQLNEVYKNKLKMIPVQIQDMERLKKLFSGTSNKKPKLATEKDNEIQTKDTTFQITYRLTVRNGQVTEDVIECGEGKMVPIIHDTIFIHDTIRITRVIHDTVTIVVHDTIFLGNGNGDGANYTLIRDTVSVFFGLGSKARLFRIIDNKFRCVEKHWVKREHPKEEIVEEANIEEENISEVDTSSSISKVRRKIPLIVIIVAAPVVIVAKGLYYVGYYSGYGIYYVAKKAINPFRDCPCDRVTGAPILKKMEKIKVKRWKKVFETTSRTKIR
jgi:hypothetical protein